MNLCKTLEAKVRETVRGDDASLSPSHEQKEEKEAESALKKEIDIVNRKCLVRTSCSAFLQFFAPLYDYGFKDAFTLTVYSLFLVA